MAGPLGLRLVSNTRGLFHATEVGAVPGGGSGAGDLAPSAAASGRLGRCARAQFLEVDREANAGSRAARAGVRPHRGGGGDDDHCLARRRALTTGLITTMRSAASANEIARSNVLLTSFEETLEQIDYRPCTDGDLVAVYTAAFNAYESSLPAAQRIVGPSGQVSATIVSADTHGGCSGGSADSGQQTLGIEVTYRGTTRVGTMVKRNPAPAEGPVAAFNADVVSSRVTRSASWRLMAVTRRHRRHLSNTCGSAAIRPAPSSAPTPPTTPSPKNAAPTTRPGSNRGLHDHAHRHRRRGGHQQHVEGRHDPGRQ